MGITQEGIVGKILPSVKFHSMSYTRDGLMMNVSTPIERKIMQDKDYLKIAYENAVKFSTDPSTNTGAILVNQHGIVVSKGANHFAAGVKDLPERWSDRDTKLFYVEHAERNAIFQAARYGIKTEGLTMYCPWFACHDCARAIIQAGIKEVIGHQLLKDLTPERWRQSINTALNMLEEAGVKLRWITDPIDDVQINFNGKVIPLNKTAGEIMKEYFGG